MWDPKIAAIFIFSGVNVEMMSLQSSNPSGSYWTDCCSLSWLDCSWLLIAPVQMVHCKDWDNVTSTSLSKPEIKSKTLTNGDQRRKSHHHFHLVQGKASLEKKWALHRWRAHHINQSQSSEGEIIFNLVKYPTIRIYVLEYLNIIIQLSEYAILPLCPSQKPWSALY